MSIVEGLTPFNKLEKYARFDIDNVDMPFKLNNLYRPHFKYTFSCWIKAGEESFIKIDNILYDVKTDWTRIVHTFTATDSSFLIYFLKKTGYDICYSQISYGDKVADWTPNSEDIVQKVTTEYESYFDIKSALILSSVKKATTILSGNNTVFSAEAPEDITKYWINEIDNLVYEYDPLKEAWVVSEYQYTQSVETLSSQLKQTSDSMNALIEQTTIEKNGQNVTLKEYVEDLNIDLDGLKNTLTVREGNNLIRDSIGCFNDGSWIGDYNLDSTNEVRSLNQYGYALLLKNSAISQNINVSNGTYTLSFKYKKHINLANARLKINDVEFVLSNNEITDFIYTFEATSGIVGLSFTADTDDSCTIINLMLNKGTEKLEWSFNQNETWTDTVKIGRGVRISSSGTDVQFVAYADIIGFVDKSGNYITTFDKNGMNTDEIVVKKRATIVKLLIQDINGQTTINRIEE